MDNLKRNSISFEQKAYVEKDVAIIGKADGTNNKIDICTAFDPLFFSISPHEAQYISFRQKLALLLAYKAFESAGYTLEKLAGKSVGVFIGATSTTGILSSANVSPHSLIGNSNAIIANRISYYFNLTGPSLTTDLQAASGLAAFHLAYHAVSSGECELALVGECFEDEASKLETGAFFVLKPAGIAEQVKDQISAVIRTVHASFGSCDGFDQVLDRNYIKSNDIQHVVVATNNDELVVNTLENLQRIFTNNVLEDHSRSLSLCRPNLINMLHMVNCIEQKKIKPMNNPYANNLSIKPFYYVAKEIDWHPSNNRMAIFLSQCDDNQHLIALQEPHYHHHSKSTLPGIFLLPFSGRTYQAMQQQKELINEYVENNTISILDLAFSLSARRNHFEHRSAMLATDISNFLATIKKPAKDCLFEGSCKAYRIPKVLFMFTGQGSQFSGMAQVMYQHFQVARLYIDQCEQIAAKHLDVPLLELLFNHEHKEKLNETRYAQPAIFAVEIALGQLLLSWGVKPHALLGHSLGEYVAATLAGAMSLEEALSMICYRGKLIQALPPGEMIAVTTSLDILQTILNNHEAVEIAAINSKQAITLTGNAEAIRAFVQDLEKHKIAYWQLEVSHAFHSYMMTQMVPIFEQYLKTIHFKPLEVAIYSNVTGELLPVGYRYTSEYWCEHLRKTVLFADCLNAIANDKIDLIVELGPHNVLLKFAQQQLANAKPCFASLQRRINDCQALLQLLAQLYVSGVNIDWQQVYANSDARYQPLPSYLFAESGAQEMSHEC